MQKRRNYEQNFDFCYGNAVECMFAERAQIEKKTRGENIFKDCHCNYYAKFLLHYFLDFQPNVECRGRRNKFHSFMMLYN